MALGIYIYPFPLEPPSHPSRLSQSTGFGFLLLLKDPFVHIPKIE